MPITTSLNETDPAIRKISMTRGRTVDRKQVMADLADLSARGRITERDVLLFEHLRELHVLSQDQIQRLFWPRASEATAYNRLYFLSRHILLDKARVPATEMAAWGLPRRKVYSLGVGGWMWLRLDVDPSVATRFWKRELVLHDLLVAEVYVRLVEACAARGSGWQVTWAGERAASFYKHTDEAKEEFAIIAPDSLALLQRQQAVLPLFFELDKGREAHGRPSSDWGRKCHGYDRFAASNWRMHPQLSNLPEFPVVAVITHGELRMQNLREAIARHRRGPVIYYLALWQSLMADKDVLSAPVWMKLLPDGRVIGQEPEQRQPLVPGVG